MASSAYKSKSSWNISKSTYIIHLHIYHNLNCKSKYVKYLLECTKCKIQYVGKAKTEFNIRLNNHRKGVSKSDAIPASRHFSGKNHNFNTHANFILIKQIRHVDTDTEKIKERLKQRENFWLLTLETLTPKGLNQELNIVACMILFNYFHCPNACWYS